MTTAIQTFLEQKRAGETLIFTIDVRPEISRYWVANHDYAAGDYARPRSSTGYDYVVTVAGRSADTEPKWDLSANIVDGTATWRPVAAGSNAIDPIIGSATVSAPSGITASVVSTSPLGDVRVSVAGGTAGTAYDVLVTVSTAGGEVLVYDLQMTVVA